MTCHPKIKSTREVAFNKGINIAVYGVAGTGKAQPVSEPIATPQGFMPIGEIEVGDFVFGRDGKPTRVEGVFPQGEKQTYTVHFSDGRSTRACAEHLWNVRYDSTRPWRTVDTSQLKESRCFIPICEPVEFPDADLPVDPYTLGVLLGGS